MTNQEAVECTPEGTFRNGKNCRQGINVAEVTRGLEQVGCKVKVGRQVARLVRIDRIGTDG